MLNTITSYPATVTKNITASHPLHLYSPIMEKRQFLHFVLLKIYSSHSEAISVFYLAGHISYPQTGCHCSFPHLAYRALQKAKRNKNASVSSLSMEKEIITAGLQLKRYQKPLITKMRAQPLHFISACLPQGKQTSHDHTPCLHKFMNHSVHMDYEVPKHY